MNKNENNINSLNAMFQRFQNYDSMSYEEDKYSFIIIKPNGAKHISIYLKELQKWSFNILGFFAIHNHEEINLALHTTERERSHIIPINFMFKDFYGNKGIMILISKKNIKYEEFVSQVFDFKWKARKLVEKNYISYVFDTSYILSIEKSQWLKILDSDGNELKKYDMNHKGAFMVALPNSLHSPDNDVECTIKELMTIYDLGIICKDNIISENMLRRVINYGTMEILKDME